MECPPAVSTELRWCSCSLHNASVHAVAARRFSDQGPAYSVTVSEVLRLALPPGSGVLAGHDLLGRTVYWARLLGSRHAEIGGTEAGEIVLLPTAGLTGTAFERTVRDLAEAGTQAILVGGELPAARLAVLDEVTLPILRLASHASLVDAERAIISLIVDRESQVRRRVEQVYERLLATLVEDSGVGSLAAEIAQVTGRPTVVLDEYFRVQDCEPDEPAARRLGDSLGAALAARDPLEPGASQAAPFRLSSGEGTAETLVVPLVLRGTPAGYLALGGVEELSELDTRIAERAARVLGIELAKQRAVTEAHLRLQGDILEDLLGGKFPSEEAMLARGRWMGHDLSRPHVVLVLGVDGRIESDAAGESHRMREADIARTELMRSEPAALLREYPGGLVLAIPRADQTGRDEAVAIGEHLREQVAGVLPRSRVTVGVGRAHPGIAGLSLAYREADQALSIARALLGGGRTVHFEDLGVQRLLFQLRDSPELASFYDDIVGRLQAHDERQGADLVNTIEAFFECHGNHVRTAQRLHLHRNTLLYRLDRARRVLGVDLDDPEVRLALQVALKIGRVIGRRPGNGAHRPET